MKLPRRDKLGRFLATKKLPKKQPAKPVGKQPAKPVGKQPAKSLARPARKPPKGLPAKPVGKLPKRQPAKPARKLPKRLPAKPVRKPPKRRPAGPARKLPKRRPAGPARKPPKRRPAKPARKLPKRQPVKKPKKRRRKPRLPPIDTRSRDAEIAIQERLVALSQAVHFLQPGLDMAVQSMVNIDKTVDGELRVGNLPAEWRDPAGLTDMIATFSNAFASFRVFDRYPPMGGSFWFSVAVRFGPQNEMEMQDLAKLYKKNKGLFQIGTYPTRADHPAPLQICLTDDRQGLRSMIHNLAEKRGLPPTTILIRLIWGPDWHPDVSGKRPGHYKGEK